MFPQRWPMIFILEMDIFCQQDGADLFSAVRGDTHGGIKIHSLRSLNIVSFAS
jgi:hypothetical protein